MTEEYMAGSAPRPRRKLNIDEKSLTLDHQLNVLKRLYDTLRVEKPDEVEAQLKKRDGSDFRELSFKVKHESLFSQKRDLVFFESERPEAGELKESTLAQIISGFGGSHSVSQLGQIALTLLANGERFGTFRILLQHLIQSPFEIGEKLTTINNLLQQIYRRNPPLFQRLNELTFELLEQNYSMLTGPAFSRAWDEFVMVK